MNMKTTFYRRHKFFSQINKSSSNFYGSPTFRKFIQENAKNEMSKIDSPFSINYDLNHIHRRLLHSKIITNPKYNQLEIESYSCKRPKKDKKTREFFLTTNKNKTVQKSRNSIKMLKINDIDENTEIIKSKNKKYDTIYPPSSSRDKNIFTIKDSNRYLNDFIKERRLINKLRYIHKLKYETKEKKENQISCGIKLIDIHQQSLLNTKDLLHKFEIEQNHYNRHLFNDLMMNQQILLKLKMKLSQLEGKVLNLNRKIDDLKGKSYIAKEYKNFLLCVKNQVISINKLKSESLDDFDQDKSKDESNIDSIKKKFTSKKSRVFVPLMRKNTLNTKEIAPRKTSKLNTLKNRKINKNLIKRASFQQRRNSDTQIFESPYEFKLQMKSIENKLIQLIKKKNKIHEEVIQLKILKEKELHSCKKSVNIDSTIKMYEELLTNYKENNNDLQNRLNSLLIEQKDNLSLNNLVYNKVKEILINIKPYSKELKNYSDIFDRVKSVLYKNKIKYKNYKSNVTFEGLIILEQIISALSNEIEIYIKNQDGLNIVKKLRLKIEKDKKFYARQNRDDLVNKYKLNLKIIEKMNKICFTSRKVPEKISFSKREHTEKKKK